MTLDGKRLASGRDFDADTGRLNPDADVALLDEAGAAALAARLEDQPFTVASVETRAHTERPEGAVHHVDAAAGGGPQARLQLGPHHARRAGPLRAGPHHLHADRLARRCRRRR